MKKALQIIMAIKYTASLAFTAMVLIFSVIRYIFGETPLPFWTIIQFLALSLLFGTWQFVVFTDHVVKNMRYGGRMVLFAIPMYLVISIFALAFGWVPVDLGSWLLFTGSYLFVLAVVSLVFSLYFRITGNKYNQMLAAYQSRREA